MTEIQRLPDIVTLQYSELMQQCIHLCSDDLPSGAIGEHDTLGGEVHINFLKDRLRIGLGVRDFDDASDSVFLTLSVNDIPGLIYWLTR